MSGVLEGFLVIAVVVAIGYGVGRAGVLGPSAVEVLSRAAFFVATPALLFVTLLRADIGAVLSAALVVTGVTSALACLAYVPIGLALRRPRGETTVGAMAGGYVNAGNLGFPIAAYALGNVAAIAPVLLFQLAVLTPVFTTLLDVWSRRDAGEAPRVLGTALAPLRNPLALATAAGLAVAISGSRVPEPVLAPIELVSDLAVPGMLLAFGISLCSAERPGAGELRRPLLAVVMIKNVVHPLLALALGRLLGLEGAALLAVVVVAALPTAQNVFAYAVRYREGETLARDAGLTTTVVAVPVLLVLVAALT